MCISPRKYLAVRDWEPSRSCPHRAAMHNLASKRAGAGAEFQQMIRRADGGLVVLHDEYGVAPCLQAAQGLEQALVILGVQTDAGFVEHVGHAHESGAQLPRQADALRLASGERAHGPRQIDVIQPHVG